LRIRSLHNLGDSDDGQASPFTKQVLNALILANGGTEGELPVPSISSARPAIASAGSSADLPNLINDPVNDRINDHLPKVSDKQSLLLTIKENEFKKSLLDLTTITGSAFTEDDINRLSHCSKWHESVQILGEQQDSSETNMSETEQIALYDSMRSPLHTILESAQHMSSVEKANHQWKGHRRLSVWSSTRMAVENAVGGFNVFLVAAVVFSVASALLWVDN